MMAAAGAQKKHTTDCGWVTKKTNSTPQQQGAVPAAVGQKKTLGALVLVRQGGDSTLGGKGSGIEDLQRQRRASSSPANPEARATGKRGATAIDTPRPSAVERVKLKRPTYPCFNHWLSPYVM